MGVGQPTKLDSLGSRQTRGTMLDVVISRSFYYLCHARWHRVEYMDSAFVILEAGRGGKHPIGQHLDTTERI